MSGKSKLRNREFRLEGFAFGPHPTDGRRVKIQLTIVSMLPAETLHVVCMSDVQRRAVSQHKRQLRSMLGATISPEAAEASIIPYAQRELTGGDLATIRPLVDQGWPGIKWTWMSVPFDAYFFPRLADGGNPAGITVSKRPELPPGDFRLTEYSWPDGVDLWFVDDDNFTDDERQLAYEKIKAKVNG